MQPPPASEENNIESYIIPWPCALFRDTNALSSALWSLSKQDRLEFVSNHSGHVVASIDDAVSILLSSADDTLMFYFFQTPSSKLSFPTTRDWILKKTSTLIYYHKKHMIAARVFHQYCYIHLYKRSSLCPTSTLPQPQAVLNMGEYFKQIDMRLDRIEQRLDILESLTLQDNTLRDTTPQLPFD